MALFKILKVKGNTRHEDLSRKARTRTCVSKHDITYDNALTLIRHRCRLRRTEKHMLDWTP